MLPDMSDVLTEWEVPVTIKTVTRITVDFEPADIIAGRTIQAVVQNANRDQLTTAQIETGQRYLMVHAKTELNRGEFIEHKGKDYKFVNDADWSDYGYYETIAEATNRPLLVVTP
jgi:hypothetical protein